MISSWKPRFKRFSRSATKHSVQTPINVTFQVSIEQIEMETARLVFEKYEAFKSTGGVGWPLVDIAPNFIYESLYSSLSSTGTPWGLVLEADYEVSVWCDNQAKEICKKLFPSAYRRKQ